MKRVLVKSVTDHIGDKSIRWQSTRWCQIGDTCQSIRWQSTLHCTCLHLAKFISVLSCSSL